MGEEAVGLDGVGLGAFARCPASERFGDGGGGRRGVEVGGGWSSLDVGPLEDGGAQSSAEVFHVEDVAKGENGGIGC